MEYEANAGSRWTAAILLNFGGGELRIANLGLDGLNS